MRFHATITAYDYLDKVGVTANVYEDAPLGERGPRVVYHKVATVQGSGEDNPEQWLRDAVITLLEEM